MYSMYAFVCVRIIHTYVLCMYVCMYVYTFHLLEDTHGLNPLYWILRGKPDVFCTKDPFSVFLS